MDGIGIPRQTLEIGAAYNLAVEDPIRLGGQGRMDELGAVAASPGMAVREMFEVRTDK